MLENQAYGLRLGRSGYDNAVPVLPACKFTLGPLNNWLT